MKKIALLTTILFASTAVFAGSIQNNSDEKVTINGKEIAKGESSPVKAGDKVSYKGGNVQIDSKKAEKNWEVNSKNELKPASAQEKSSNEQKSNSGAAASSSNAAPAAPAATPASAQKQETKAPATSNQ